MYGVSVTPRESLLIRSWSAAIHLIDNGIGPLRVWAVGFGGGTGEGMGASSRRDGRVIEKNIGHLLDISHAIVIFAVVSPV